MGTELRRLDLRLLQYTLLVGSPASCILHLLDLDCQKVETVGLPTKLPGVCSQGNNTRLISTQPNDLSLTTLGHLL